jgi:hypothetical protein
MRSLAEWVLALGVVWAGLWLGWPLVQRLAPPASGTFTLVESALPALPAGVPAGAQNVPFLVLETGSTLQRGMAEARLTAPSFSRHTAGAPITEPGVLGPRTILPLRSGASRFWVVLDRTEAGREREVTAIYVR